MFIGPEPVLDIFFCYVQLRGLRPYYLPQHLKGYFSSGSGKLNPEVIRKSYLGQFLTFMKAVDRSAKKGAK